MNYDEKYEYERVLGLSGSYTNGDLKRAHRRAAKAYHPDVASFHGIPRDLAEENMKRANDAYDELSKLFLEWPYPKTIESDYNPVGDQIEDGFFIFDDEVFLGAIIQFGRYPTRKDNSFTPLDWYVIQVEDDYATIITDQCIDCRPFHGSRGPITWAASDIRTWLNTVFLDRAFNADEASAILKTELNNSICNGCGMYGGGDTVDNVFLLSVDEASKYFADRIDLATTVTEFAEKRGSYCDENKQGFWWLRSPGGVEDSVSYVAPNGYIHSYDGRMAVSDDYSVRPAVRIRLKRRYKDKLERDTARAKKKSAIEKKQEEELARERSRRAAEERESRMAEERRREAEQRAREEGYSPVRRDVAVGDVVAFGHYPDTVPLNWRVLDVEDDSVLLISECPVSQRPFAYDAKMANWENSLVRSWLNSEFINEVFTDAERSAILQTKVSGQVSDCIDRVFCLSKNEAEQYFANNQDRTASGSTDANGVPASWWLRTQGSFGDSYVCVVLGFGKILGMGLSCSDGAVSVRPSIWVRR